MRDAAAIRIILAVSAAFAVSQACSQPPIRKLSLDWPIKFPLVGCDNGEAVPNFSASIVGGPTPHCPPAIGPSRSDPPARVEGEAELEVGTIVIVGFSHEQVVLAADSRSGVFRQGNGQRSFQRVDDSRCKAVAVSPTILFAAAGATKTDARLPGNIYYDAQALAAEAVRTFDPARNSGGLPETMVTSIAEDWAWQVAFRIRRGVRSGAYPAPIGSTWLIGVFAGLDENGEIAVAVARLDYQPDRPGMIVPPVSITIATPTPPPDFTWIEAVGLTEVANRL